MNAVIFLVVAALVVWLYVRSMRSTTSGRLPRVERSERIGGQGNYGQEVVGESNYQSALRSVCGPGEVRCKCEAVLFLEDANEYDSKAVMVTIDGRCVGYLSKEAARAYRRRFKHLGNFAGFCPAVIVGGGSGRSSVGVWLDLDLE